ncbi:MAG TPA: DUF1801 domain-containing protein [Actinomycetes bacterium]|nr:DUF1801 domain-containing protein [Actinomycetes bacterium]
MRSDATTAEAYLAGLAPEPREVVAQVRQLVLANLPDGYEETMAWGMLCWVVPLERYPETYNGQPLGYVALAAQKRYYSLYLMTLYPDGEREREFRTRWQAGGRRLDMGKSCLRFRRVDDLDLDLLAETIAAVPVEDFLALYEQARDSRG